MNLYTVYLVLNISELLRQPGDGMVSQICFTRQIGMNVTLIINCATKSHNTVARPRFLHC